MRSTDETIPAAIEESAATGTAVELSHGKDGLYWAICGQLARVSTSDTQFDDVSRFWGESNGRPWNVIVRSGIVL